MLALGLAAAICGLSSALALVVSLAWIGTPKALSGIMAGSIVRMGVPLAAVALITKLSPGISNAGYLRFTLIFFLGCLVLESALLLWGLKALQQRSVRDPVSREVLNG